jgi:outer membrane biosynthesis protein TonB
LPLLLSGCIHKKNQAQVQPPLAPPIEVAPLQKPDPTPVNLPLSEPTTPPVPATPPPKVELKPPPKHKKTPPKTTPAQAQTTQQASNTPPPEVSAAGQFSTGEPADLRQETAGTISDTEKGLNGITRQLNDQEQKTALQIREFLKQAKAALGSGDVDGAHTLAAKAKVLLGELSQ